ncbi:hypothetical protein FHS41_001533 [Streptomyces violarus]|uniref:Uncharacterized protein n=1 Tax=Streptomyces violarus TaxID=67380 RepID=A0A7W5F048_9ACTN|nr:hypothetical protein [Streptomyces violarus]MBB3075064.1 hypothetical protein [Streptomyces violarus]
MADLASRLRATMSSDEDMVPTPEQTGQALNVAVYGTGPAWW